VPIWLRRAAAYFARFLPRAAATAASATRSIARACFYLRAFVGARDEEPSVMENLHGGIGLLTPCPPGPLARATVISKSAGSICTSTSSASGNTATVASGVERPLASVTGTRFTRVTRFRI